MVARRGVGCAHWPDPMDSSAGASFDPDLALQISPRRRVVWTRAERKHLDACAEDFVTHGDRLVLECGLQTCPDPRIHLAAAFSAPGGAVLRCGCTDRVFSRTV
jgi:hypothetical protein